MLRAVTDAASLGGFFRTALRKLVKVTSDIEDAPDALTEGGDTFRATMHVHGPLLAMVPGLDGAARDLVFKAARPAATEKDAGAKESVQTLAALMKPASVSPARMARPIGSRTIATRRRRCCRGF